MNSGTSSKGRVGIAAENPEPFSFFTNSSNKTGFPECLNSWLNFFNALNNLCMEGFNVSKSLKNLCDETGPCAPSETVRALQGMVAWDTLSQLTMGATSSVKASITSMMQDYININYKINNSPSLPESEKIKLREKCNLIVAQQLFHLMNLGCQFGIVCNENLGAFTTCPLCRTPKCMHEPDCIMSVFQHNFCRPKAETGNNLIQTAANSQDFSIDSSNQLGSATSGELEAWLAEDGVGSIPNQPVEHTTSKLNQWGVPSGPLPNPGVLTSMKTPFLRVPRGPFGYQLFPLVGRRWSEAAAAEMGQSVADDGTMRRWSMPWEQGRGAGALPAYALPPAPPYPMAPHQYMAYQRRLKLAQIALSADRSRSTTPEWQSVADSQDGLADAIQLLSIRWPRAAAPGTAATPAPAPPPPAHYAGLHASIMNIPEDPTEDPVRRPTNNIGSPGGWVAGRVDTSGGRVDTNSGRVDTSGGRVDMSGGRADTNGGRVDTSGGRVDTSGGRVDTSGGGIGPGTFAAHPGGGTGASDYIHDSMNLGQGNSLSYDSERTTSIWQPPDRNTGFNFGTTSQNIHNHFK